MKRFNLKEISERSILSYRQALRNADIYYPEYSATTMTFNKSNYEYEIIDGSEAHYKLINRERCRQIVYTNPKQYKSALGYIYKYEDQITHWITISPRRPAITNKLTAPLDDVTLTHTAREIFNYLHRLNGGMTTIMVNALELNLNSADLSYLGRHAHILVMAPNVTASWKDQEEHIQKIVKENLGQYYNNSDGKVTCLMKNYDMWYRQNGDWTALDYAHKNSNLDTGIQLTKNYILIK